VTRNFEKQSVPPAKYLVFDDVKDKLPLRYQNPNKEKIYIDQYGDRDKLKLVDIIRPLAPWENNPHCLRSILGPSRASRGAQKQQLTKSELQQQLSALSKLKEVTESMKQQGIENTEKEAIESEPPGLVIRSP
jgi:hypothetical protein